MPTNSGRCVGSVPADSGTGCWRPSEPARPSTSTIGRNRPSSIASPSAMSHQAVLTVMPANAEPLLFDAEVNAYSTSEKPCGPTLSAVLWLPVAMAAAVPISTRVGVTRKYSDASLISRAPIFLPRYSGVRPTINPATNTVITASTRMPYSPAPTPPGATSPSIILMIGSIPPSAVYESWNESTDPVEVSVVDAANVAESGTPNRISLPSIAAPTACGTVPPWASSKPLVSAMLAIARIAMTATI